MKIALRALLIFSLFFLPLSLLFYFSVKHPFLIESELTASNFVIDKIGIMDAESNEILYEETSSTEWKPGQTIIIYAHPEKVSQTIKFAPILKRYYTR